MAAGIASLFDRNETASKRHRQTNETKETDGEDEDNTVPTIQQAPTVPTMNTFDLYRKSVIFNGTYLIQMVP